MANAGIGRGIGLQEGGEKIGERSGMGLVGEWRLELQHLPGQGEVDEDTDNIHNGCNKRS